ncbi:MAG: molybdenum ABC transporter ATP-binding protein [Geminicoccaceae bacterium]
MSVLEVDVAGQVGSFAVDVRFASEGGVTALFGHSGAGKTTVVNMIGGLVRPRRGRIVVDGRTLFDADRGIDLPPHRRRLGHVFQEGRLLPHLSVRQNLLYGRWFSRARADPGRFDEVVELLGIEGLLGRRPRSLSGGERQRVAVGRALLNAPAALLMDEPLASLDGPRKAEILPYLERLRDQARLPIIYVSHAIDEVAQLARTMVLMSDGRVVATGPIAEIMNRLDLRPMTGRFEAGVVIEGIVRAHDQTFQLSTVSIGRQSLVVPLLAEELGARVRLRVRARDVALATERPTGISIQNILPGKVIELSREEGTFVEVNVDVDGTVLTARLTRRAVAVLRLAPGQPVFALVKSIALDRVVRLGADRDPAG